MSIVPAHPNALGLVETLWQSGALTPTSLTLSDDLDYDTFEAFGAWLGTVRRGGQWWTGDYINFGERTYKERMAQAAEATGLSPQSLLNVASICRRVPPQVRRTNVPFSTHAEVAALNPPEQAEWLDKVEANGWTKQTLREEMRDIPIGGKQPIVEPAANLEQAARDLFGSAKRYGADGFLIPRHAFLALAFALGEEV